MKKALLPVAVLVVVTLALAALVGCAEETTTTTTATGTTTETTAVTEATSTTAGISAAEVDAAIAAVTKSPNIQTPKTLKSGELQAGSDTSFPPMEFSDGKGGYVGFDIDLCTALAKKMGLELKVIPTAWDGIIPALVSEKFDFIMSAMTITEERRQRIDFSDPYLAANIAITAPVDKPIKSPPELAGKTVGVQVDTTGQFAVEKVQGVKEIKKYDTILVAFQDLEAGRLDAVVNDTPVNAYIIKNKPWFANTGEFVTNDNYGYAIKKGNTELLNAINQALKEVKDEGLYDKIYTKWLGASK